MKSTTLSDQLGCDISVDQTLSRPFFVRYARGRFGEFQRCKEPTGERRAHEGATHFRRYLSVKRIDAYSRDRDSARLVFHCGVQMIHYQKRMPRFSRMPKRVATAEDIEASDLLKKENQEAERVRQIEHSITKIMDADRGDSFDDLSSVVIVTINLQ